MCKSIFGGEKMEILLDKRTQVLVKEYVPPKNKLRALADFFGMLGDSTRIKILSALSISSMCVSDITSLLELNQTTVSHQLRSLRSMGIVDYKRQGRVVFYYLCDKRVLEVLNNAVACI